MSPEELIKIFPPDTPASRGGTKRDYDVKITINKNGYGRDCMRFAFLNKAHEIVEDFNYIRVSSLAIKRDRIYFLFSKEKSGKSRAFKRLHRKSEHVRYFTVTPDPGIEEKRYRTEWLNHTYSIKYDGECDCYYIKYDGECDCYYIENEKEAKS